MEPRRLHYNADVMEHAVTQSALKAQTHPRRWVWNTRFEQGLADFRCRPNATRTQLYLQRLAVLDPRNRLEVGVEAAACVPVRKADRITEGRAFAALSALRHVGMPPQLKV